MDKKKKKEKSTDHCKGIEKPDVVVYAFNPRPREHCRCRERIAKTA